MPDTLLRPLRLTGLRRDAEVLERWAETVLRLLAAARAVVDADLPHVRDEAEGLVRHLLRVLEALGTEPDTPHGPEGLQAAADTLRAAESRETLLEIANGFRFQSKASRAAVRALQSARSVLCALPERIER